MSHHEVDIMSKTYCFSSANKHSHYNRQKALFERNLFQLENNKKEVKVSQHVLMIAELFSNLSRPCKTGSQNGRRRPSLIV